MGRGYRSVLRASNPSSHACSLVVLEHATDSYDSPIPYLARSYRQIWRSDHWSLVSHSKCIFCMHRSLSNQRCGLQCEMLSFPA